MPKLFGNGAPRDREIRPGAEGSTTRRGANDGSSRASLHSRVQDAIRQLSQVIGGLDSALEKFRKRDETLFKMMVSSIQERDNARATILANEIAEVRKYTRMVMGSRLVLEQMILRLNTIGQLGEVISALSPATTLIGSLREGLHGLLPEAEERMGEISGLLGEILMDAKTSGQVTSMEVPQQSVRSQDASDEADRLLVEAAALAEASMEEREEDEEGLQGASGHDPESEMDMEPA